MRFALMFLVVFSFTQNILAIDDEGTPCKTVGEPEVKLADTFTLPHSELGADQLLRLRQSGVQKGRELLVCNSNLKWSYPTREQLLYFLSSAKTDPSFKTNIDPDKDLFFKSVAFLGSSPGKSASYEDVQSAVGGYDHPTLSDGPLDSPTASSQHAALLNIANVWARNSLLGNHSCMVDPAKCPKTQAVRAQKAQAADSGAMVAVVSEGKKVVAVDLHPVSLPAPAPEAKKPTDATDIAAIFKDAGAKNTAYLRSVSNGTCCPQDTDKDDSTRHPCSEMEQKFGFAAYSVVTEPDGKEQVVVPISSDAATYKDKSALEVRYLIVSKTSDPRMLAKKGTVLVSKVDGKYQWIEDSKSVNPKVSVIRAIKKLSVSDIEGGQAANQTAPSCRLVTNQRDWAPIVGFSTGAIFSKPDRTKR